MTHAFAEIAAETRRVPAAPAAPELSIRGLRKTFPGRPPVLDGIDFDLFRRESVAIIGANGAGKSTLLRCCLRLVEFEAGSVALLGEDIGSLPAERLRRLRARVGFVFQRHNLVPRLSALSNVVHGAQARSRGPFLWTHHGAPRRVREEAMHCLDLVGLADRAAQRVDRLSGGQSQRVAIARALMQRPALVFADEPAASLDPRAGEEMMAIFHDLIARERLTFLFTSHNLAHAVTYGHRLIGLRAGRVCMDDPAARHSVAVLRDLYD